MPGSRRKGEERARKTKDRLDDAAVRVKEEKELSGPKTVIHEVESGAKSASRAEQHCSIASDATETLRIPRG